MPEALTKEDIFRMFAESDRKFNETFRETDRIFQQTSKEIREDFKEVREAFAETDKKFQETDKSFAETDKRFKETDREIRSLHGLFTGQWGKLIESLVAPSSIRLFRQREIKVTEIYQRIKAQRNGSNMEIDILLVNDDVAVVVSVKTTLKVDDVREHLEDLEEFTTFFPRYKGVKLYGAVAGINIEEKSDKFAYRQGLFVLTSSGEGMIEMLNDEKFRPKDFETSSS